MHFCRGFNVYYYLWGMAQARYRRDEVVQFGVIEPNAISTENNHPGWPYPAPLSTQIFFPSPVYPRHPHNDECVCLKVLMMFSNALVMFSAISTVVLFENIWFWVRLSILARTFALNSPTGSPDPSELTTNSPTTTYSTNNQ